MLRNAVKSLFFIVLIAGSLTACSTAKKKTTEGGDNSAVVDNGSNSGIGFEINGDSDSKKAGGLVTVYFDYNSSGLRQDTIDSLQNNVAFLKKNTTVKVNVEGHCDERGSVQYNLALGEKRAKAIKEYLTSNGVEASRVSVISLGKERPLAFGHDEGAWSQNRRGNFVIIAK